MNSVASRTVILGIPASEYGDFWTVAWPAALEYLLVSMISMFDTIMVGVLGTDAIAVVGLAVQPKNIMTSFATALCVGVVAVVARREGAGDRREAVNTLKQSMVMGAILILAVNAAAIAGAEFIMRAAGTEEKLLGEAALYLRIVLFGNIFHSMALIINAAQRGVSNTRVALVTNITANVINLIFNWLLIAGHLGFPALGVAGAGWATLLGNIAAFVLAMYSVVKPGAKLNILGSAGWKLTKRTCGSVLSVFSGAFVEQVFMRIGTFSFACVVSRLGTLMYAAHNVCMNLIGISFSIGDGLGSATAGLVGQNLGAKDKDGAVRAAKVSQYISLIFVTIMLLILAVFRIRIIRLFNTDPQMTAACTSIFPVLMLNIFFQIATVTVSSCLRGAGDVKYVAKVTFVGLTIIRPGLGWLLCYPFGLGLVGCWIGMMTDQITRRLLLELRFRKGVWLTKEV